MTRTCPKALLLFSSAFAGLGATAIATPAEACGGFFCSNQPVMQTGEEIIFAVDPGAERVRAVVKINYAGSAPDFAWLLPLPSVPEDLGVATARAFIALDGATAPRFFPRVEYDQGCRGGFGAVDAAASFSDAGSGGGQVVVLQQQDVGPYSSVVLEGTDANAIRAWLVEHGYNVTDEMMRAVVPYLEKGDKLFALRLQNDTTAGDIQPIAFTLHSSEPCIPLRLTAIAAQDDMMVTAAVLSNAGRAVPSNYLHVDPNPMLINWLNFGSNYRSVLSRAADEAGGNAFTTEYAGSSEVMRRTIYLEGEYSTSAILAEHTLAGVIDQLGFQGLPRRAELRAILQHLLTNEFLSEHGLDPTAFWACPNCDREKLLAIPFDPTELVAELEARIFAPDRQVQALFDDYGTLTRLTTIISPSEMNIDPVFSFRTDLPDVANVHNATVRIHCDASGVSTGGEVTLEDGTHFAVDTFGNVLGAVADSAAADLIEQLETGEVKVDNRGSNRGTTQPPRPIDEVSRMSSCGCSAAEGTSGVAGLGAIGAAIFGLALRRRRARVPRRPTLEG